jgi:hypothetical protein
MSRQRGGLGRRLGARHRTTLELGRRAVPLGLMAGGALLGSALLGCGPSGGIEQLGALRVTVTAVNGQPPPPVDSPLPPNLGATNETWDFTVEALDKDGQLDSGFTGFVRMASDPGSLLEVQGGEGRNVLLGGGYGQGTAVVTAVWGPSRLRAEDMGYVPAPPGVVPTCANGLDDDGDVLVDFPNDPGCAFANDMSEGPGTYETGVSAAVPYEYPAVADVQGRSSQTPYPSVALQVNTAAPHDVLVTRVASTGFFVTDLSETAGYNHLYAYNFNLPWNMRVCDRLTYLSGTASEFFGFTELSFPSYQVSYIVKPSGEPFTPEECPIPAPPVIDGPLLNDPVAIESLESGLVRIDGWSIASNFGPELAVNNSFGPNRSSCDFNQDGTVDYYDALEGSCSNACTTDPTCSEWYSYEARGNYKVSLGAVAVLINTATAFGFDPLAHKGETIPSVTGTLRHFSGGDLNWTIEARCIDDLVCGYEPCPPSPVAPNLACISVRTEIDDDEGTI